MPQSISTYEFKLVGSMTLKQFLKLAAGVAIGLIFYATKMATFFRWAPLLVFSGLGAAFAFVPFEDLPLERWVILFFRRIYSPTLYFWQQSQLPAAPFPYQSQGQPESKSEDDLGVTFGAPRVTVSESAETTVVNQEEVKRAGEAQVKEAEVKIEVEPEPVKIEEASAEEKVIFEPVAQVEYSKPSYEAPKNAVEAEFEAVPLPAAPTVPNIVVGIVLDSEGKMLKDAIVEIQNEKGEPLRALRSNALGQFRIATPLENGKYFIFTEKEPYGFDTIEINLENQIVPAIKIKAKEKIAIN